MKNQKTKEQGLILYSKWRQGSLRGHKHIGEQICEDYNITQEDLDNRKRVILNRYRRLYRGRKKAELDIIEKVGIQT